MTDAFFSSSTTIDLLRHGKPEGGEIFRGSTDVPISDEGYQQMQQSYDKVSAHDLVITSPMLRCKTFAADVAKAKQLPLVEVEALKELHFGDWDGQSFEQVRTQYSELFNAYWQDPLNNTPPNAEPMRDFIQRIQQAFWQQIEAYRGQRILMVAHGAVNRVILSDILQSDAVSLLRYDVPYACISRIKIYHDDNGDWPQMVFHNR